MDRLRLRCSSQRTGVFDLTGQSLAIGRHPDNDVTIRDDLASRFHCIVETDERGRYRVQDLGSRNGTRVNGDRVGAASLHEGDVVTVGRHRFAVEELPKPEPEPAPVGAPEEAADEGGASKKRVRSRAGTVQADRSWARSLREAIEELPDSGDDETITLLDKNRAELSSLSSDADGPVALRLLLLLSARARATDLHTEPKGDAVAVRMRVDGQMIHTVDLPNSVGEVINGVIKTACQMPAAGRDAVLDGGFSARLRNRRVDFRASLTPTVHGQKLVVRILDARVAPQSLSGLGMPAYMHQRIQTMCQQDTGLLLTTGPTGSGKTTTLYNAIRDIDRETRNVVTIEDPVEYYLDNVTQIPVKQSEGFGVMLRSVLRQDPDVILVGEIRDQETARVAMQAAMTGHLVFSTVHSRDSIGAIFRLLDLGVEQYLVANALDVVVAQRLVRLLCEKCKRKVRVSPGQASRMGRYLEGKDAVHTATGCSACFRTGYQGRRALFEMLDFNDDLRDIVLRNPTIHEMRKTIEQGVFTTLQQAGWLLAARGDTSLDEVEKVVGRG